MNDDIIKLLDLKMKTMKSKALYVALTKNDSPYDNRRPVF